MRKIGLTGGIGCGKTTVLQQFRELGIPCFVADEWAKTYYDDPDFCHSIRQLFGNSVFDTNGSVDKKQLAYLVFGDEEKLSQLNALIHPRVMDDFAQWCSQQTADYVIFESAILYEHHLDEQMDAVIAVYLDKAERIKRLQLRDQASIKAIEDRMRHQLSAETKMDRADYVILNYEGNPRRRQVAHIDAMLRSLP